MSYTIRVSLPGYNALTDTNLDHYALYADQDNILIKEKVRGSVTIASGEDLTIDHNLGYVPLCFVYYNDGGNWKMPKMATATDVIVWVSVSTISLYISCLSSPGYDFKYYIFYDNLT